MKKLKQTMSENNLTISRSSIQSSTVEGEYTEPIPVDLLIVILSRVPSKSIARFRCVSKSWANILRLPYFTELFLTKSLNHPRLLFTLQVHGKLYLFSCPHTDGDSSLVATRYQTHSFNGSYENSFSLINGLLCLHYWRGDWRGGCMDVMPMMCNPVTGESLTLSEVKPNSFCPTLYCGYDPTDKQFKVLCVCSKSNSNPPQVLTLNSTGKHLWRVTECKPHAPMFFSRGICIDGVLYYLAESASQGMIVCFDVRSEKFSFIITDDEIMTRACTLVNYKGKLGVVQLINVCKNLQLWLVEQDHAGKYEFSSSIYELPRSFGLFYIVGMTGTSDIVLARHYLSDPFYVFYYNVERKALTRVEIQGFQEFKHPGTRVSTFEDYVEDIKLIECL